jgi:hypothetical protein
MSEEEIPPAAIDAVLAAARSRCGCGSFHEYDCYLGQLDREEAAVLLKAATPHIAAAERERLQDSMPSITIQVADGGSVSPGQWQELGEQLAAACRYQIASAVQAERERLGQLATHVDATYLSLEDGHTPLQFADLITDKAGA